MEHLIAEIPFPKKNYYMQTHHIHYDYNFINNKTEHYTAFDMEQIFAVLPCDPIHSYMHPEPVTDQTPRKAFVTGFLKGHHNFTHPYIIFLLRDLKMCQNLKLFVDMSY